MKNTHYSFISACINPLLDIGLFHLFPLIPILRFWNPVFLMSSTHLICGRPAFLFVILGLHLNIFFVHFSSLVLATCPAHLHF